MQNLSVYLLHRIGLQLNTLQEYINLFTSVGKAVDKHAGYYAYARRHLNYTVGENGRDIMYKARRVGYVRDRSRLNFRVTDMDTLQLALNGAIGGIRIVE